MTIVVTHSLIQSPAPGKRLCVFEGDTIRFELRCRDPLPGRAFVRTNIGHVSQRRREIIRSVERDEVQFFMDWYDIPLIPYDENRHVINLPLTQSGHFEAKCYFLSSEGTMLWPEGDNTEINVKPAHTIGGNTIYNAFIRLFGPGKYGRDYEREFDLSPLDEAGFAVIPPSGRFRDLIEELDFIVHELGCRYIQLLPIFPVPTTFGRMGRFGSPYAVLDFFMVDPSLAEFDPHATPVEQFMELVEEVHRRGARVILDIPINHTGWGSRIHDVHPEWLKRTREGEIEVPEVWGVRWEDLTRLDYSRKELWEYMAEVFLVWCRRGVDGFRGDAGYMIPRQVWEYIIARVKDSFPETVFFLEGLGGDISITRTLLCRGGYDWAYSEIFQNYTPEQIEPYELFAREVSNEDGLMIHFCETHDNNRLASVSTTYAKMRTALCALLSFCGGFGFANGVEWFATEKINVHQMTSLNWGSKENQVEHIRRLNHILLRHPCFQRVGDVKFLRAGSGNFLAFERREEGGDGALLVLVNLDCQREQYLVWREGSVKCNTPLYDLLSGERFSPSREGKGIYGARLSPGEVRCLSPFKEDLDVVRREGGEDASFIQRARAMLLRTFEFLKGTSNVAFDLDIETRSFLEDPLSFLRHRWGVRGVQVVVWKWPEDVKREVVLPQGHLLLVESSFPFRIELALNKKVLFASHSLRYRGGYFSIFFPPPKISPEMTEIGMRIWVYEEGEILKRDAHILWVPAGVSPLKLEYTRREILKRSYTMLLSNSRGSMCYIPVWWGSIQSKYHGLLVANLSPDSLEDRMVLLPRMQVWVLNQGYYAEVKKDYIQRFFYGPGEYGRWDFYIPTGLGKHIHLSIVLSLDDTENRIWVRFYRHLPGGEGEEEREVEVVVRPDVDWRSHHYLTKAYLGPEPQWNSWVGVEPRGFSFGPAEKDRLHIEVSKGSFHPEPRWEYMVHLPVEEERGMEAETDLFSPGYFKFSMGAGEQVEICAYIQCERGRRPSPFPYNPRPFCELEYALRRAMEQFVVRPGDSYSVVAGYPWFTDWGRDSLIFCRGLLAAGKSHLVKEILSYLGGFEDKGTLPNLIKGKRPLNRDTSDAPLWFLLVCRELMEKEGEKVLELRAGERDLKEVIYSIATSYIQGTDNGIRMDMDSGLIYSPAHFTWMDTNYPACTPREGYPIEIQALWYAALELMERLDKDSGHCPVAGGWSFIKKKVKKSILELFYLEEKGYLSDCLHASSFVEARQAVRDDHLRPNQLFALTLSAVEEKDICSSVLSWCESLIVPGALRSLADRRTQCPAITIPSEVFEDPYYFYQGRYEGEEDRSRKLAYHNGTAWCWLFPALCEAWLKIRGEPFKKGLCSLLMSASLLLRTGCVGQMPEILDGDFPHTQRGCLAQAWSVSEFYRVLRLFLFYPDSKI